MRRKNGSSPATKDDLEIAVAQISNAVIKTLQNYPTKDDVPSKADHRRLENKVNQLDEKVNDLDHKVDNLASDVSDVRRRVIDLEHDTPTQREVDELKRFVGFHPKS